MKLELKLSDEFSSFAANGTLGNEFRVKKIEPFWHKVDKVVLDFEGVHSMTDSFANALIGNLAEQHPSDFRQKLRFVNCSSLTKSFIKGALQFASSRVAIA